MTTEKEWLGNEPAPHQIKISDLKLPAPKPTIGRIVQYRLTRDDCRSINARREDADMNRPGDARSGVMVHVGNRAIPGDVYPAMIVRVWGDHHDAVVNLQVHLDGNDTFWVTSVSEGSEEGSYAWPAR